jgi:hypothetical protein
MNNKLITLSLFSVLMSMSSLNQAAESFYKWVDERGVTHYSQNPPDENRKIKPETVNVSTYVPRGTEDAAKKSEQQRSEKMESLKTNKNGKEGVTKVGDASKKPDVSKAKPEYKQKCAELKKNMEILTSRGDNVRMQDANGEQRQMTSEELALKRDETQRSIKAFCE